MLKGGGLVCICSYCFSNFNKYVIFFSDTVYHLQLI